MDTKHDDRLIAALEEGAPMEAACQSAGLDQKEVEHRMEQEPGFACRVVQAAATAQIGFLKTICQAAEKGDWRAAAWWLERRVEGFTKDKPEQGDQTDDKRIVEVVIRKEGRCSPRKRKTKPATKPKSGKKK
jgi:hypothetical protein